ncbi:MAG: hypothetical protein ACOX02_03115 [Acholeplasmatales bacterium]
MFFITIVSGISFFVVFTREVSKLYEQYPIEAYPDGIPKEALADWATNVVPMIVGLALLMVIVGVIYLIFYILSIVNSYKLEDKTPFILLLIGIFVGVVGVVGLFFLMIATNKVIQKEKEKPKQIDGVTL